MKYVLDTSILIEVDRENKKVIKILKKLSKEHDVYISVITISEILTGSYLRDDYEKAVNKAKLIMGQFIWVNMDPIIAEKTAEINAYLITEGKKIEIQDVIIGATFIALKCDFILTLNKEHFERIPVLQNKIKSPDEI